MERKRLENNLTNRRAREVVLAARLHHAQGIAMKHHDAALQSLAAVNHPEGFERHVFERTFDVKRPIYTVWSWLNRTETFTKGQVPPYRVEFIPNRFEVGVLTSHHGPGLSFSGIITTMDAPYYRELQYFYGSYFLSLRLIRPTNLEFWLEEQGDTTRVKLRVTSWARIGFRRAWTALQAGFWPFFGLTLKTMPRELPPSPEPSA